jgi:hypothetical protein
VQAFQFDRREKNPRSLSYHRYRDCRVGLRPCTERLPGHGLITPRARGPPRHDERERHNARDGKEVIS